jgi:hypothetical protein
MPGWLTRVLRRVVSLATEGKIRITGKALFELGSIEMGLDAEDVRDVLMRLEESDSAGRLASADTDEWMYMFKPRLFDETVYVKLILRAECVVVSFHREGGEDHEEDV